MEIILSNYTGIEQESFLTTIELWKKLTKQGKKVFSPIMLGHLLSYYLDLKSDYKTWKWLNELFVLATRFHIILFDNWENSIGLKAELKQVIKLGKPIKYYDSELKRKVLTVNELEVILNWIGENNG